MITAIDSAPPTPSPKPRYPAEAVRVTQRNVKQVARAVAAETANVKVSVSGSEILLAGPPDVKALRSALTPKESVGNDVRKRSATDWASTYFRR